MKKTLKRTTLFLTALLLLILSAISTPRQSFAENQYPEIYFSDEYTAEPYNDGDYCLKYTFRLYMPSAIFNGYTNSVLEIELKTTVSPKPNILWLNNNNVEQIKQTLQVYGTSGSITTPFLNNTQQYAELNKIPVETNYILTYVESLDMYYTDISIAVHRSCTDLYLYTYLRSTNLDYLSKANSPTVYWMDDVYDYIDDVYRTEMQEQIANLQAEKMQLQAQIETKNNEINNLNSQIAKLNGQIVELQNDILELGQEHSAELERKQAEYDSLVAEKGLIETELEEKKLALKTCEESLNMTEEGYYNVIRQHEKTINDLQVENSDLKKENAELQKQLSNAKQSGCAMSFSASLPAGFVLIVSAGLIIGRIFYARRKEN